MNLYEEQFNGKAVLYTFAKQLKRCFRSFHKILTGRYKTVKNKYQPRLQLLSSLFSILKGIISAIQACKIQNFLGGGPPNPPHKRKGASPPSVPPPATHFRVAVAPCATARKCSAFFFVLRSHPWTSNTKQYDIHSVLNGLSL